MQKAVIDLIASRMVEDDTELTIRNEQHKILAKGRMVEGQNIPILFVQNERISLDG